MSNATMRVRTYTASPTNEGRFDDIIKRVSDQQALLARCAHGVANQAVPGGASGVLGPFGIRPA